VSGSGKETTERRSKDVPFGTSGVLSEIEGGESVCESGKERAEV
jgi:hypothetical protein